ncbi:MAG: potassium-transporting ATPase subunit KdpC [Chthoniobacteraceae bacterium]
MKTLLQSLRAVLVLTVLTGLVYPLLVTVVSQALFARKANGSLLYEDGKLLGSELLAQKTEDARYFWPRPSAADYATVASGASNKGPTSADLVKAITERRAKLGAAAPVELLTASGSGLDPHLSPEAARFQAERIASARGVDVEKVRALIASLAEPPQFGIFGEPRVNVFILNRALDGLR